MRRGKLTYTPAFGRDGSAAPWWREATVTLREAVARKRQHCSACGAVIEEGDAYLTSPYTSNPQGRLPAYG